MKLDRLARNTADAIDIARQLEAANVDLVIKDLDVDTRTPAGALMYTIFASLAQFERERISERQREGIENAKAKGVSIQDIENELRSRFNDR